MLDGPSLSLRTHTVETEVNFHKPFSDLHRHAKQSPLEILKNEKTSLSLPECVCEDMKTYYNYSFIKHHNLQFQRDIQLLTRCNY